MVLSFPDLAHCAKSGKKIIMASLFAKIASGEIPAIILYEDSHTLAFLDIGPASRGHTLVIPRDEYADLYAMPPELLAAVMATVQRVATALRDTLAPDGLNVVQNNGVAAGQTVFHYHVHLIPRWAGDDVIQPWQVQQLSQDELQAIAEQVRAAIVSPTV